VAVAHLAWLFLFSARMGGRDFDDDKNVRPKTSGSFTLLLALAKICFVSDT